MGGELFLTLAHVAATAWGAWVFRSVALVDVAGVGAGLLGLVAATRTCIRPGPGVPLHRLQDQSLQLAVHAAMTVAGASILGAAENVGWWWDGAGLSLAGCWTPDPAYQTLARAGELYLLAQFMVWAYMGLSCLFLEERSRDFAVMMTHHVVTVVLVGMAWAGRDWRSAIVCLFLHDASDVFVDLMKIAHYLGLGGPRFGYATEGLWALNMVTWVLCRCVLFPLFVHGHIFVQYRVGGATGRLHMLPFFLETNALLCLLQCMHVYWCALLARIGYRALWVEHGARTAAVGAEMYDKN